MLSHHIRTPGGKLRARGAGVPFVGTPGRFNAITDVAGIEVGYCTLISGEGRLVVGQGPVRTGVTAILPRGRARGADGVFAGYFSFNGNGEMSGTHWVEEAGRCDGPITITNSHSVGVARDATIRWIVEHFPDKFATGNSFAMPVAAETLDGFLNDVNGFHVTNEHVWAAIDSATEGAIEEGSVGGGTGMRCFEFKGGSGTASRVIEVDGHTYTVGAFVQSNHGLRHLCTIAGVPVGLHLPKTETVREDGGSIIGIVATDAPLLPHQLKRVARRCASGIARSGAVPSNSSGDLFLAFSTANHAAFHETEHRAQAEFLPEFILSPIFEATVQAVDESVMNSIIGNQTMVGRDNHRVEGLPVEQVQELLRRHGRLVEPLP
ncbi:MAG TPA: P1 family peptidase [Steroidobacteraceae bacterium]|nr:P1 family peptidase [Steroidobacteraceae bacterium]